MPENSDQPQHVIVEKRQNKNAVTTATVEKMVEVHRIRTKHELEKQIKEKTDAHVKNCRQWKDMRSAAVLSINDHASLAVHADEDITALTQTLRKVMGFSKSALPSIISRVYWSIPDRGDFELWVPEEGKTKAHFDRAAWASGWIRVDISTCLTVDRHGYADVNGARNYKVKITPAHVAALGSLRKFAITLSKDSTEIDMLQDRLANAGKSSEMMKANVLTRSIGEEENGAALQALLETAVRTTVKGSDYLALLGE